MSDEQKLYISPEDDLTTVRERLEGISAKHITLIIPSQTQLRSHVAWKLLYARVKELNKEVLIVSSDPQVRSVAHAVKFKVAHSLESVSPIPGRSRAGNPPSRSMRPGSGERVRPSGTTSRPLSERGAVPGGSGGSRNSRNLANPAGPQGPRGTRSRSLNQNRSAPRSSNRQEPESEIQPSPELRESPREEPPLAHEPQIISSAFDTPEEQYSQAYDFRINPASPIRPLSPETIEEPDLLLEDYAQAQDIREAASGSYPRVDKAAIERERRRQEQGIRVQRGEDPFVYMDDDSRPPLREQHARVSIEGIEPLEQREHVIQDIPDLPTSVIEGDIEYTGDQDEFLPPVSSRPITQSWREGNKSESEHEAASQSYSVRPRTGRSSKYLNPPPAREVYDDDALPPVQERPQGARPSVPLQPRPATPAAPTTGRQSGKMTPAADAGTSARPRPSGTIGNAPGISAGTRNSGKMLPPNGEVLARPRPTSPIAPAQTGAGPRTSGKMMPLTSPSPVELPRTGARGAAAPTTNASGQKKGTRPTGSTRPATRTGQSQVGPSRAAASRASRKAPAAAAGTGQRLRLRTIGTIALFVLLLVAFGMWVWLGTSTNVVITANTQDYSHTINLAFSANRQPRTLPAQKFTKEFTKSGTGSATGSKNVSTQPASGSVIFTNSGNNPIDIPSETIVQTANGVQFKTTYDVLIQPSSKGGEPIPVPIQAINNIGANGNVAARTITVVPETSLVNIGKAQTQPISAADLGRILSVTNNEPTQGGGEKPTPAIVAADLDNARADLHRQLQAEIDAWATQIGKNAIVSTPSTVDTLVNPPAVDTVENDGKFPATVKVNASVLLVLNSDVERAALPTLNDALHQDSGGKYKTASILSNTQPAVKIDQVKQTGGDANSMTLSMNATGKFVPGISEESVRNKIAGKGLSEAKSLLKTGDVQKVDISNSPGFVTWGVTARKERINVSIVPAQTSTPKK